MKKFKLSCLSVLMVLFLCLCGCEIFPANTYDLLSPPELTGDYRPIGQALAKRVGNTYRLRYPSGGDYRSAIILYDVDADEEKEAFAFYSLNEEETHINMISRKDGKWVSVDDQVITAGGVEKVFFADLDADGIEEILVGWEIQTSAEKQLTVYSKRDEKLNQRMLQRYSEYICSDLDEDGKKELFIQQLNTLDSTNRASVYTLQKDGIIEIASSTLDRGVKSIVSLYESTLSNGQKAIYIDELKSSGAITEVLFLNKGTLVNPLLEETSGENSRTARSALLMSKDINHDGIIEIPVAEEVPSAESEGAAEKVYAIKWSSFSGETLVNKRAEIVNQNYGYTLVLPEKWIGNIAVSADAKYRSRFFFATDEQKIPTERLIELYAYELPKNSEEKVSLAEGCEEVCRTDKYIIAARTVAASHPLSISMDELKKSIHLND